jgi:hypothetical protein
MPEGWHCFYEGSRLVCEATGAPPTPELCCEPGAERACMTWSSARYGTQPCAVGGDRWDACEEAAEVPAECAAIDGWFSPSVETCIVSEGSCCQDAWDLDNDGDFWEPIGNCIDVVCPSG